MLKQMNLGVKCICNLVSRCLFVYFMLQKGSTSVAPVEFPTSIRRLYYRYLPLRSLCSFVNLLTITVHSVNGRPHWLAK